MQQEQLDQLTAMHQKTGGYISFVDHRYTYIVTRKKSYVMHSSYSVVVPGEPDHLLIFALVRCYFLGVLFDINTPGRRVPSTILLNFSTMPRFGKPGKAFSHKYEGGIAEARAHMRKIREWNCTQVHLTVCYPE